MTEYYELVRFMRGVGYIAGTVTLAFTPERKCGCCANKLCSALPSNEGVIGLCSDLTL